MSAPRRGRPGYDRGDVLAGAVEVFNERGYEATSVSDIATRLGLSKSALYHHFSSKEALLSAALDVALDELDSVWDLPAGDTAFERLETVIRGATDVLVSRLAYVTLLLRLRGNSEVERAALERRRAFDARVAGLVREAQSAGDVRSDIDAGRAARLIFGTLNSIVEWYHGDGSDHIGADILALTLTGLRPQRG